MKNNTLLILFIAINYISLALYGLTKLFGQQNFEIINLINSTEKTKFSLIVSSYGSGSTFLGEILNSVSENFYHYEPLWDYGYNQIREFGSPDSKVQRIKSLFKCDYCNLREYIEYTSYNEYLLQQNTRLWKLCTEFPEICRKSKLLTKVCKIYPFQSMKVNRLRLKFTEEFLLDETLNDIKIILLVRDPRGTINSRKFKPWCARTPECLDTRSLCSDLVDDFIAADSLKRLYPKNFRVVRFEDLTFNIYEVINDLFDFLGLPFSNEVRQYLETHTKNLVKDSVTIRDTKMIPFKWKKQLNESEIRFIEENCKDAMKFWGYSRFSHSDSNVI